MGVMRSELFLIACTETGPCLQRHANTCRLKLYMILIISTSLYTPTWTRCVIMSSKPKLLSYNCIYIYIYIWVLRRTHSDWPRLSREKRISVKQIIKPKLLPSDSFSALLTTTERRWDFFSSTSPASTVPKEKCEVRYHYLTQVIMIF